MPSLILYQPVELAPFCPVRSPSTSADHLLLDEPVVLRLSSLYFYGNLGLLLAPRFDLEFLPGSPEPLRFVSPVALRVLSGEILVTAIYDKSSERIAAVPLRWGAPRIVVLHAGFKHFLGPKLDEEVSETSRRWRYEFDPFSDLVVSPWHPDDVGSMNECRFRTVDKIVHRIANAASEDLLTGTVQLFPSYTSSQSQG